MQTKERLLSYFPKVEIDVDYDMPKGLTGLYERDTEIPHGNIVIDGRLNYYLQNGILAEELGHHATSYGDITHYKGKRFNLDSARQEVRARRYGVKLIMPLERLIECYKSGHWGDMYAICLHLEIDRTYFKDAIEDYKKQFGAYVKYDGYLIEFEPLNIEEV
ncbi:ImmA/IrrE family metallo-endopeptidase [Salinicoccus carnicancri]|uniref:ImmA/IrrE family metallo-endopeptidase n=1 Tax=Salinicoccus carnicancri TaxID=558170 RepID=UPI00036912FF|nr:hypothetical protein [Salinicoccus carnicancri]